MLKSLTLIATASIGLEKVVADELKALGYTDLIIENGRVLFSAEPKDICRCNIWLRAADRVLIKIGAFKAFTFDELFDQTKALPWGEIIGPNDSFPVVKSVSVKSTLYSRSDCQRLVKKSVVDSLKKYHKVQTLPETGETYPIRVEINKDQVLLSIDTSGEGLHKRGYRLAGHIAPLRETIAAGLVLLSRWKGGDRAFLDPMCGTGTLLIEAAMIARNIAPGLKRNFCSEGWPMISENHWKDARVEAKELAKLDEKFLIFGSDKDYRVLQSARENFASAGFEDIFVQKMDVTDIGSKYKNGVIVTNPPYGVRLDDRDDVNELYKVMGQVFQEKFPEWSYYIITPNEFFEGLFKKQASKKRKLFNGGIQCWYFQYYGRNFKKPRPKRVEEKPDMNVVFM